MPRLQKNLRERLSRLVPALFYTLLIVFLALYLKGLDWHHLQHVHVSWFYVVVATIVALLARFWSVLIWITLLKNLGAQGLKGSLRELTYIYSKSWLGRYIPGTAPWILGKIYFASKHGIAKEKLAVSSLLEGGLEILMLILVAFLLLLTDRRASIIPTDLKILMAAAMVGGLIAVTPVVFNRLMGIAYRLLRKRKLSAEHLPDGRTIVQGCSLYVVGALLNGLSFFFISKAVFPGLSSHDIFYVMGASNFAGAVGMLAIFIPSGIGVREGVLLVMLNAIVPKEISLVITVAGRLWSVLIDLLFFALSAVYVRQPKPR